MVLSEFYPGDLGYRVPEELRQGNNEISLLVQATAAAPSRLETLLRSYQLSSLEMKNTAQQVAFISEDI